MRTALYARISRDPEDQRAGVDEQLRQGRAFAERHGWIVAAEYSDNDASAFNGKARPGFNELQDAVRSGEVEAIVFQHQDRLARDVAVFTAFRDLCRDHDVRLEAFDGSSVDAATASGRFQSTIQAATDEHYSALISEKAQAGHRRLARSGRPNGGGRGGRPFAYERDRMTVRADEAAIVHELAERFLGGEPIRSLATDLNRRGVTTTTGGPWRTARVRDLLRSARYAGLRSHRGEVIGQAAWEPIIDRATWERCRALLAAPERRSWEGGPRRYLLTSGLAVCGVCEGSLIARPLRGKRSYACRPTTEGGCGKVRVTAEPFEAHVAEAIVEALDTPALLDAIAAEADDGELGEVLDRLRDDEQTLEQLARDHYADRIISRAEYLVAREVVEDRIAASRRRIVAIDSRPLMADLPSGGEAVRAAWDAGDLAWRRALVSTVVEAVVVHPAIRGQNFFNSMRVEVRWKA